MVAQQDDEIVDISLEEAIGQKTKNVNPTGELVVLAKAMGVWIWGLKIIQPKNQKHKIRDKGETKEKNAMG